MKLIEGEMDPFAKVPTNQRPSLLPNMLFVHGVGMWPSLYGPLHDALTEPLFKRAPALSVAGQHVWIRPGYERVPTARDLDDQLDVLGKELSNRSPVVVIGVSGGATLALACAVRHTDGLAGIVTHEPLIGPLEPQLHAKVNDAAQRLKMSPSMANAVDFLQLLYAPAWDQLPRVAKEWAAAHHRTVCAEVEQFASFAPDIDELRTIDIPHLTTVGSRSGADRQRVAALLEDAGATRRCVDGSGHLVHWENPISYAETVGSWLTTVAAR